MAKAQYLSTRGISRVQNILNRYATAEAKDIRDGFKSRAKTLNRERYGMMELAGQLGAKCGCENLAGRERCVCGSSPKMLRMRLQKLRARY